MSNPPEGGEYSIPKRTSTRFLTRHILASDRHAFIGRVYDLGIVTLHFDSYDELAQHPDCKYACDVGDCVSTVARRVESLNLAGDLMWPENMPDSFGQFPVSRYDWLQVAADVFLMRYVSVVDCAIILTNDVFQKELDPSKCSIPALKKEQVDPKVIDVLQRMLDDQGSLRSERNRRSHHGQERPFTQDDQTFRIASTFEHRSQGLTGHDRFGRKIDVARSFKEGLVGLQRDFNQAIKRLVRNLDELYDLLGEEFEARFGPLVTAATHGLNARAQVRTAQTKA